MRKRILLILSVMLLACTIGCGSKKDNNVKVYEDTEETVVVHQEASLTAVVTSIDLENNIIGFKDCVNGSTRELAYHGGVNVTNTYGDYINVSDIACGSVVDIVYYSDTNRLVSIALNSSAKVIKNVDKFYADVEQKKATYKGTSCPLSEYATAYDDGAPIDIREVNTEDEVTLNIYGGKLVSVVIDIGHGYVKLKNQDTYVGGMVEIGYDVIVPVTSDMLVAVREGQYTLRINKGGYNATKQVTVQKGRETVVDLGDIAVPSGTATFNVTPAEAEIYVDGNKIAGNIYTGVYGNHSLKITAEGYNSFSGSFELSKPTKTYTINLTEDGSAEEDDDSSEETTTGSTDNSTTSTSGTTASDGSTDTTAAPTTMSATSVTAATTTEGTGSDTGSDSTTSTSATTTETTQSGQATNNKITIKEPVGVSVYVDGDYVGVAPVSFTKVVGTHTITLYKTGYLIKSYTIQAKDDGKDDEYKFGALTLLP